MISKYRAGIGLCGIVCFVGALFVITPDIWSVVGAGCLWISGFLAGKLTILKEKGDL